MGDPGARGFPGKKVSEKEKLQTNKARESSSHLIFYRYTCTIYICLVACSSDLLYRERKVPEVQPVREVILERRGMK